MSKLKLASFALIAFFFYGCADIFFWNAPVKKIQPTSKSLPTGFIRGIIRRLSYQDSGYCYDIIASDTTNGKLPSGKYCADKFYYNVGDIVYVGVKNGKIASMLLIESSNLKSGNAKKTHKADIVKSGKKRDESKKSSIDVPTNENISFD